MFKTLQKVTLQDLEDFDDILDFQKPESIEQHAQAFKPTVDQKLVDRALNDFVADPSSAFQEDLTSSKQPQAFEVKASPGARSTNWLLTRF